MQYEIYGDEKQAEMNPYLCGQDDALPPGAKYGPVIRDSYIVEACTGGSGSVIINGTEFPLHAGDCFVLLPGDVVIHTASEEDPRRGVWCCVKGASIPGYLKALGITSASPFIPRAAYAAVLAEMEALYRLEKESDAGAEIRRSAHLHMLFGELMRYAPAEAYSGRYIRRAIHIMEMRYSEPLKVQAIADEIGLERCYFSTLFARSTGKTPHEYLIQLRIRKACQLLEDDSLPISRIAQAVGIDAVGFARIFQRHTGLLPSAYRARKAAPPGS